MQTVTEAHAKSVKELARDKDLMVDNKDVDNVDLQSKYSEFINKTVLSCMPSSTHRKHLHTNSDFANDQFSMREPSNLRSGSQLGS